MKIKRTIEGMDVEIELTVDELIAAREETEKQAIRYKLNSLYRHGMLAEDALHDEDLMHNLLEDMHYSIELDGMSESDAIDTAIERFVRITKTDAFDDAFRDWLSK